MRSRCSRLKAQEQKEVHEQMVIALPHIVKAHVEKAKTGSLQHTQWLWGVVKEADAEEQNAGVKTSLASLLMEQLKDQL